MLDRRADDKLTAEYWRRSRSARRGAFVIFAGGCLLIGVVQAIVPERYLLGMVLPLVPIIFTVAFLQELAVWRCPSCGRPFTRAHRAPICEHCRMEFGLDSRK